MCVHTFWVNAMNITLSVDERLADRARKAAQAMGKSLNQAVRDYLEQLAGSQQLEAELNAFEQSALATPGRLGGWTFDREEANQRA
jgi:antitoxin component of RelBE/YafQ-DinJ toxin-antitoxin module